MCAGSDAELSKARQDRIDGHLASEARLKNLAAKAQGECRHWPMKHSKGIALIDGICALAVQMLNFRRGPLRQPITIVEIDGDPFFDGVESHRRYDDDWGRFEEIDGHLTDAANRLVAAHNFMSGAGASSVGIISSPESPVYVTYGPDPRKPKRRAGAKVKYPGIREFTDICLGKEPKLTTKELFKRCRAKFTDPDSMPGDVESFADYLRKRPPRSKAAKKKPGQ
jgi:hypothetical protein